MAERGKGPLLRHLVSRIELKLGLFGKLEVKRLASLEVSVKDRAS